MATNGQRERGSLQRLDQVDPPSIGIPGSSCMFVHITHQTLPTVVWQDSLSPSPSPQPMRRAGSSQHCHQQCSTVEGGLRSPCHGIALVKLQAALCSVQCAGSTHPVARVWVCGCGRTSRTGQTESHGNPVELHLWSGSRRDILYSRHTSANPLSRNHCRVRQEVSDCVAPSGPHATGSHLSPCVGLKLSGSPGRATVRPGRLCGRVCYGEQVQAVDSISAACSSAWGDQFPLLGWVGQVYHAPAGRERGVKRGFWGVGGGRAKKRKKKKLECQNFGKGASSDGAARCHLSGPVSHPLPMLIIIIGGDVCMGPRNSVVHGVSSERRCWILG